MDKTQINVERMRTCDAQWEEQKHPRAENGQFTSGSGSAGSSAMSNAEPAAKSPLKKAAAVAKGEKAAAGKGTGIAYAPEKEEPVSAPVQSPLQKAAATVSQNSKGNEPPAPGMKKVLPEYTRMLKNSIERNMEDYQDEIKRKNPDVRYAQEKMQRIMRMQSELNEIEANNGYWTPGQNPKDPFVGSTSPSKGPSDNTRFKKDLAAVENDPRDGSVILRERKAEINKLIDELRSTKNNYRSMALHEEILRLQYEYDQIDRKI